LLAVTTNVLARLHRTQAAATATVEAKLVLDQLERDLQGAVLRAGGGSWLDVRILSSAGALPSHGWLVQTSPPMKPAAESLLLVPEVAGGSPPAISNARFGLSGVWLRLVTPDHDSGANGSVPSAVAYQVVRRPVSTAAGAPVRYALFREKLSGASTFASVLGPLFTDTAPADLTQPDSADVIASNVVDFGVWLHARDASGRLTRLFPADRTGPLSARFPAEGAPVLADVMVRVLSEEGAALIQSIEEGRVELPPGQTPGEWWWAVVEAHSHVFTRRVEVKGGAL